MKQEQRNRLFKKETFITGGAILFVVLAIIGGGYHLFTSISQSEAYNTLQVGTLQISYVNKGEGLGDVLRLADALPISDEEGKRSIPYRFDVQNTGTLPMTYRIKLVDDDSIIESDFCGKKQLSKEYIKYQLDSRLPKVLGSKNEEGYIIYEGKLSSGSSRIHEVRIWIDENSPISALDKHYHGKVFVEIVSSIGESSIESFSLEK